MINANIDILIKKTGSLIESLDKHISGLANQPVSTVDWLTLVSAILAAIISGISIYMTFRSDKKNRESSERIAGQIQTAENKRAEAAIDANLTANARIEWIQNVRQATAELITACYKYIGAEPVERQEDWEAMQEKKALYVLYFGPDDDDSKETLANDLFDKKTNKGKNNKFVSFVNSLYSDLSTYHQNHSLLKNYEKDINKCNLCYSHNEENYEVQEVYKCQKDEYGTLFNEEDCTEYITRLKEHIKNHMEIERKILTNLQDLSEFMRMYGKIEWNRAKEGK
ncbi:hypothetical protein [Clostridium algidicarnis]|uniref:hypothetical protein n=1 Tax=Clostridium algidicarnis TaxID=37659 RepID=UPI001C0C044D|nr:hypothetical protein [Clostridium algidicarnis]MBU3227358.1 hypothetical protein [Clostridium algidicarnis]MBU3250881.1 hypothetical protein [Clostridium algidicarnis]